jgi:hypothetical protein
MRNKPVSLGMRPPIFEHLSLEVKARRPQMIVPEFVGELRAACQNFETENVDLLMQRAAQSARVLP